MHSLIARTNYRIQERLLGRETFSFLRELEKTQSWTRQNIRQLQFDRLKRVIDHAYAKTSYWRTVMKQRRIQNYDIRSLEDLQKFPLLNKETVRAERELMVDRENRRRLMLVTTSGSTNEALQFFCDSHREAQINAARIRGHRWIGINKGEREMYFWGSPIELSKQDRVKKLRDWLINDGLTNGFEIRPDLVHQYYNHWLHWRPKCIFGYPNSLRLMVLMARSEGIDLQTLRQFGLTTICTTSEMLTEPDRQLISEAFGVPVYDSYGLREVGLIGHECSHQNMHTTDEHFILETIDPQTLEPTDAEGELVVTNIYSTVMPIIRYRTGDMVQLSPEPCQCGLGLNRLKVNGGRVADFVVTSDGRWIPGYAFIYICRSIPGITKFQVHQNANGQIRLLIVVDERFPTDGIDQAVTMLRKRLRSDDDVAVERVEDIQPAISGKYRPVISQLAEARLRQANRSANLHDAAI